MQFSHYNCFLLKLACCHGDFKSDDSCLKLLFDIQENKRLCKNIKFSYLKHLLV